MGSPDAEAKPGADRAGSVAGERLGRYELAKRLAVGGMAEIYLARARGHGDFQKWVVLKRILPQLAGGETYVRMFLDEARLAAALHHPHIAQVFDIDRDGRGYFFAMEYVPGRDLYRIQRAARDRGETVPLEHAIAIVVAVAAGLHYAHDKRDDEGKPLGIVHRDVSPSNVLVSWEGGVKLLDFGVAKAASHRAITRQGLLKGKVAYMAPEQCRGEPVDRRSDVFALGILLYELTTGAPLFSGETDYAILHQITDVDVPRPSARRPDYPPQLEAIVLRALQRDRQLRYPTAEEMQIELENFARDHGLVTSPVELGRWIRDLFPDRERDEDLVPPAAGGEPPPLHVRDEGGLRRVEAAPRPRRGLRRALVLGALALVLAVGVTEIVRRTDASRAEVTPSPRAQEKTEMDAGGPDAPAAKAVATPAKRAPTTRRRPAAGKKAPGTRTPKQAERPGIDLDAPFPPL